MPYSQGRVVHDADAHIMETPTWLRDHAEAAYRDRLPGPALPGGNELRQTGDPADQQRDLAGGLRRVCGRGTPRPSTGPTRRPRSWRARTSPPRARSSPRTAPVPSTSSGSRASSSSTPSTTGGCTTSSTADVDLAYAAARAHNRGMLEFCSVDPRLLPSLYVPLVDPERAVAATRDALDAGRGRAAGRLGLPAAVLAQPHRPVRRVGPGRGGRHPRRLPRRRHGDADRPRLLRQRQAGPARLPRRRGELPLGRLHGHPGPAGPDAGHPDLRRGARGVSRSCTSA